ncbi:hypothetical protein D3C84_1031350 [compost metagenome]
MGRAGRALDVASLIAFTVGDQVSYITSEVYGVGNGVAPRLREYFAWGICRCSEIDLSIEQTGGTQYVGSSPGDYCRPCAGHQLESTTVSQRPVNAATARLG